MCVFVCVCLCTDVRALALSYISVLANTVCVHA